MPLIMTTLHSCPILLTASKAGDPGSSDLCLGLRVGTDDTMRVRGSLV